jgi:hypothetical protein
MSNLNELQSRFINVKDKVEFSYQIEVYNCFGHNYKSTVQRGCINHKFDERVAIWCPKLYLIKGRDWINIMNDQETIIYEKNANEVRHAEFIDYIMNRTRLVRYVFVHSKDHQGILKYRFKGEFTLNRRLSIALQLAVWERTNTRVKIYESH